MTAGSSAANMAGRLGLTAWRRKSTLLGAIAGLVLVLLCLQYSALPNRLGPEAAEHQHRAEAQIQQQQPLRTLRYLPKVVPAVDRAAETNRLEGNSAEVVRFVNSGPGDSDIQHDSPRDDLEPPAVHEEQRDEEVAAAVRVVQGETPSRDEMARRQQSQQPEQLQQMSEQLEQMGVARVALDPHTPLIPRHRLVHLDLKGAPPKMAYLRQLLPILKQLGATGLLLEWEDMFPFTGTLARVAATNHYTHDEVRSLLVQARDLGLEAIPLVQTFGHLEFVLKLEPFSGLREVPDIPQALCPSRNDSVALIGRMIDQVVAAHAAVSPPRYVHIGCDEVFTMGECSRCRQQPRDDLFLAHVARVARMVRTRHSAIPIIWDDMLRHVPAATMQEYSLGELVEPMVWVYAEKVYHFVMPAVWDKYASVFPQIWTASAFKGAFGETLYVPNVKRHLENNLRWLEVMTNENNKFSRGFAGIALTGWQRYDHFAVLCEVLPAAVPSLAISLAAVTHGFFNMSLRAPLYAALHCPPQHPGKTNLPSAFLNLNNDPYVWDRFSSCGFPGVAAFRLTSRLDAAEKEVNDYLVTTTRKKGWLTDYNIKRNFTSPLRIDELMADHSRLLHSMLSLARHAKDALSEAFDGHTVGEWVEQKIVPYIKKLERLQKDTEILKEVKVWPVRPLPADPILRRLGIESSDVERRERVGAEGLSRGGK